MEQLFIASNNKGKIKEIKTILGSIVKDFLIPEDLKITEKVIEDGKTFLENAKKKAEYFYDKTGILTLSDDSGLEVDILDGAPGVNSARFAGENADDLENNIKLLDIMRNIPEDKRRAQFRCIMVLKGEKTLEIAEGICKGKISSKMKGLSGFGYDPLFIPENYNKTFAELGNKVKNKISHRRK
ncbi:non-canonical purine NTP pyrophosphatase, RdgB/HAM1 family, partial [candidate division KSB1 bacterium]